MEAVEVGEKNDCRGVAGIPVTFGHYGFDVALDIDIL